MLTTSRKPCSISTAVWFTLPPPKQRDAPCVRLASPEATAASWSARARSSRSDTAISRPSEVTTIAWAMPGTRRTKLDTSQFTFCASLLSCAIAVLEKVRAYGTGQPPPPGPQRYRESAGPPSVSRSEQARGARLDAPQRVVVELDAADAARAGQHPGLRRERQRREHAADALEAHPQALQVAGELLDPVDLAPPLDLHRHVGAVLVPAQQVDRADVGAVLAADQAPAVAEDLAALGQQLLEVALDAVLDQPRVQPQLVGGVVQDLLQGDGHGLAGAVADQPAIGFLAQGAGRGHPVERLVAAAVGVDQHRAVGLDDQQAGGRREVGVEPAGVVDAAGGDDEARGAGASRPTIGRSRDRSAASLGIRAGPGGLADVQLSMAAIRFVASFSRNG